MNILTGLPRVTGQAIPLIDVNIAQDRRRLSQQSDGTEDPVNDQPIVTLDELMMGWGLLQMYGAQALLTPESKEIVPMKTLPERVATSLLTACNDQTGLIHGINFQLLADALGTQRETIGAIIRAFKRQGLIDVGYRYMRILDNTALEDLCSARSL